MIDSNDFWKEKEQKSIETKDEENKRKKYPSFLLLCLVTTVGVMFALGLSFSAINFINENETINTIISNITGDDNKDKYIITYVENNVEDGASNQSIIKDDFLHIIDAKVSKTTDGGNGKIVYFGGLLLTTKNTFASDKSIITYEITLKNDSSTDKIFEKLLFNKDDKLKYTISGINQGDKIRAGETTTIYLTVEYKTDEKTNYPVTIESSVDISYRKENKSIHITDAKYSEGKNGGSGEVLYYEGLFLITKNKLESSSSQISYKVYIKNDSDEAEAFSGLIYNPNGDVKYTLTGINDGDVLEPGQSVIAYLLVEGNGNLKYPVEVESSIEIRYAPFTIVDKNNGIRLVNQFPTADEKGKLFEGTNYVYKFTLIVGKKMAGAYYEITAVPNDDNTLDPSYIKLYLEKNNSGVPMTYKDNGRVKVYTDYKESSHQEAVGKLILSDYITEEDATRGKIDFKLRMWVSEDVKLNETNVETFNNKKFGVKINTYAQFGR